MAGLGSEYVARLSGSGHWHRSLALVLVLVMAGAGCATTDQAEEGDEEFDLATFCNAAIEGEAIFIEGPEFDEEGNPTPEGLEELTNQMDPLLEDIEANTPDEIAAETQTILDGVRTALDEGDPAATESPEFLEADLAMDEYVYENCELENRQEIVAVNYAFEGVPEEMPSGQVALRLDNQGSEVHEAVVFHISDETDLSVQELLDLPEEEAEELAEFTGVAFAGPGEQGSTVVDLESGRYALVCFVPVGTTSLQALMESFAEEESAEGEGEAAEGEGPEGEGEEEGPPPHFTQGMFTEFTVG